MKGLFVVFLPIVLCQSIYNVQFVNVQNVATPATIDVFPTGGIEDWTIAPYADETASVGDVFVFNYFSVVHNVIRFKNKTVFDACTVKDNTTYDVLSAQPPAFVPYPYSFTVDREGDHYISCSIGNHCAMGMKIVIKASGTATTPKRKAIKVVGPYWTVVRYPNVTINQNDFLRFYSDPEHNVALYNSVSDYTACNPSNTTFREVIDWNNSPSNTPKSYQFTNPGTYYVACTVENGIHCQFGMRFVLTVLPTSNYSSERVIASSFTGSYLQADLLRLNARFAPGATVNFPNVTNGTIPAGTSSASSFFTRWTQVVNPMNGKADFVNFGSNQFVLGVSYTFFNNLNNKTAPVQDVLIGNIQNGYISSLDIRTDPAYPSLFM